MTKKDEVLAPGVVGVKELPTNHLQPNPHNPRMLFDREPLNILKQSILKVGILVPLTVYQRSSDRQFIILDGQRRWMCAQKLELNRVPVNQVEEPTLVHNIVTMFQIHKLREDWELMPTALKLEVLMGELKEKNDRKLAELTGLDAAVVTRCKKLLSFSKDKQDLMLDPNPEKRVKADLFIEMYPVVNDRLVKNMSWYSRDKFIESMLQKHQEPSGGIKAVTDFRKVKQHVTNARIANQIPVITQKLKEFVEGIELTTDHLVIEDANVSVEARALQRNVKNLEEVFNDLDVEAYLGEDKLWDALESLLRVIRKQLLAAGRRINE